MVEDFASSVLHTRRASLAGQPYASRHVGERSCARAGVYILEIIASQGWGVLADVIWGKMLKGQEKQGENVKEKGNKGKKGRKGKEKEKMGSKKGKIKTK